METVRGGDTWRRHQRHWHCYADEAAVGKEINYDGRAPDAIALTPDEVLAWLAGQAERLLPRVASDRRSDAQRFTDDETLRDIHLSALSWGKSTGGIIGLSAGTVTHLYAHSVGPAESPHAQSWIVSAICTIHSST